LRYISLLHARTHTPLFINIAGGGEVGGVELPSKLLERANQTFIKQSERDREGKNGSKVFPSSYHFTSWKGD
jgi:hypothetical protein